MLHHHIRGSITKHHLLFFDTYLDKKYIKIASIWTLVRNIFWRYNIFTNEKYLTLHYWWKNPWSIICFLEIHRFTSSLYPSLLHLSNWVSCSCRQQQYFTCCYRLEVYHTSCLFTYFALWIKATWSDLYIMVTWYLKISNTWSNIRIVIGLTARILYNKMNR